jgi:molecular chaperone HtpG
VPPRLAEILARAPAQRADTEALLATASKVLRDNKLVFFPDYTDHGLAHVQAVLDTADELVSDELLESGLLHPSDVFALCSATALHDIAMHMHESGFVELVAEGSAWAPLPWFRDHHQSRPRDRPWDELWRAFMAEARHFSNSELEHLLGPSHTGVPKVAFGPELLDRDDWTTPDRLLIGEFLRRHHARLAHEVTIYGMPGAADGFPRLTPGPLADAAGVIARSHGESLRSIYAFLTYSHQNAPRPYGVLAHYLMAVLRIADFLQLQADRAPDLLLHMRDPPSLTTLREWHRHEAVNRIELKPQVRGLIYVEVMPGHSLSTHLALEDMLKALQVELDTTNGALAEAYVAATLQVIKLEHQRVDSNIDKPAIRESLNYVPMLARLRSSGDLFRLVVSDLYGAEPVIAGRELLQNAIDAVHLRWRRESADGLGPCAADLDDPTAVTVRLTMSGDTAQLEVIDKGIGMTPEVVTNYFLAAGASFATESVTNGPESADGRWTRAGRFGIGALAGFLLGPVVQVETRHVDSSEGLMFDAHLNSELVELARNEKVSGGTRVSIGFDADRLSLPQMQRRRHEAAYRYLREVARYYVMQRPRVRYELVDEGTVEALELEGFVPDSGEEGDNWRHVGLSSGQELHWAVTENRSMRRVDRPGGGLTTNLAHNGFEIRPCRLHRKRGKHGYRWSAPALADSVQAPYLAVTDPRHSLPLTLDRFSLQGGVLPFERELAEAIGEDVVAHAFAGITDRYPLGIERRLSHVVGRNGWFPLSPGLVEALMGPQDTVWVLMTNNNDARKGFLSAAASFGEQGRWGMVVPATNRRAADLFRGEAGPRWPLKVAVQVTVLPQSIADTRRHDVFMRAESRDIDGKRVVIRERGETRKYAATLKKAASTIVEHGASSFELVIFTRVDLDAESLGADDPIADVWMDIVGGPMPSEAAAREDKARQAIEGRPGIGRLMETWG